MPEARLFELHERFPVPIDAIADPADIAIFGDHFGERTYYADYAGIARKYGPRAILEIGVRYGYSGIALCLGARAFGQTMLFYTGCDAELFGEDQGRAYRLYRSNAVARENFRRFAPFVWAELFTVNTQDGLPPQVGGGQIGSTTYTPAVYDLISVDGDHSYAGALKDCWQTWPLLRAGGIMLVDDISFAHVRPAVLDFIHEREAAGDRLLWQHHANERGMLIIRKGED